jgi:hypothetical protein
MLTQRGYQITHSINLGSGKESIIQAITDKFRYTTYKDGTQWGISTIHQPLTKIKVDLKGNIVSQYPSERKGYSPERMLTILEIMAEIEALGVSLNLEGSHT